MTPASNTPRLAFPLAVLAARIMAWCVLGIGLVAGSALVYTRSPEAALGLMFSHSVQVLILFAFAHFMQNSSQIAAGLFAVWCIWGLLSSMQGSDDPIAAALGYLFGVFNFVGCAGVVKGFNTKARP
jgi:tryptophan-rich sensory protein